MSTGVPAIGSPLPRLISTRVKPNLMQGKGSVAKEPQNFALAIIQTVGVRTGSVPKIDSFTKLFCPDCIIKLLQRLSMYGYRASAFNNALSIKSLTDSVSVTLRTNIDAFSTTAVNFFGVISQAHETEFATETTELNPHIDFRQKKPFASEKINLESAIKIHPIVCCESLFKSVCVPLSCFSLIVRIRIIRVTLAGSLR